MVKICVIKTSVASESQATKLAEELIGAKLAACVQISGPGLSIYRWQDKLEQEQEYYLNIKSGIDRREAAVSWLSKSHPYETPEIIWTEFETTDVYADWLSDATEEKPK